MANESRLELVVGRKPQTLATCVSAIPLTWLAMFRSVDLVLSRSVRFTAGWESALARLQDPQGLRTMFTSYGDISRHTSVLADTLTAHARGSAEGAIRVSIEVSEIAGQHPDPRAWARALGTALDALDDSAPSPAPLAPPTTTVDEMTEIDKIRQLRLSADLGIGEARAQLRDHDGDLQAALAAIEAGKSPEQRARDLAGAFIAHLANPQLLPQRQPWQVLLEASAVEYGVPFPPADLILESAPPADRDLRVHTRLLGESVTAGAVSWEPGYQM